MNRLARFGLLPDDSGQSSPDRLETLVLVVDPALALQYLSRSRVGRSPCPRAVARFARDMLSGCWALNGEALVFDREGFLLNGRRRLLALIRAGVAVPMLIVRGVDPSVAETHDSGDPRGLVELLTNRGEPRPALLAATLRLLDRFWAEGEPDQGPVTPRDLLALLDDIPRIRASLELVLAQGWSPPTPVPALALAHYALVGVPEEEEALTEFFSRLGSGEGPSQGPILALRRRLLGRRPPRGMAAVQAIFQAWDDWLELLGLEETPRPGQGSVPSNGASP